MKIHDLLNENNISLLSRPSDKRDAIKSLVKLMKKNDNLKSVGEFQKTVFEREDNTSSLINDFVVVPYGVSNTVNKIGLSAMVLKDGIDYNDKKVNILFLVAVPEKDKDELDEILKDIKDIVRTKAVREKLINASSKEEFINILEDVERDIALDKIDDNVNKHIVNSAMYLLPFVVAGGLFICFGLLFDNYLINPMNFGMNNGIAKFLTVIGNSIINLMYYITAGFIGYSISKGPGFVVGLVGGFFACNGTFNLDNEIIGSGLFGVIIAGLLGGYLVIWLKKLFNKLPRKYDKFKKNLLYPVVALLLISIIMFFVNPLFTYLSNEFIRFFDSLHIVNKALLGLILGGMMGFDLGGPISKSAYAFGIGLLSSGHYEVMAAIMAGAMVPPLATALLVTFFPNKVTDNEKCVGFVNYILGFVGISEGAIPFVLKDIINTVPTFMIGSACAGMATMIFECSSLAPFGGVFVLGSITNPVLFMIAVLFGAAVSTLILAKFRKDKNK